MLSERKIFFQPTFSGVLFSIRKAIFSIFNKIAFFLSSILHKTIRYLLQGIKILSFGPLNLAICRETCVMVVNDNIIVNYTWHIKIHMQACLSPLSILTVP